MLADIICFLENLKPTIVFSQEVQIVIQVKLKFQYIII